MKLKSICALFVFFITIASASIPPGHFQKYNHPIMAVYNFTTKESLHKAKLRYSDLPVCDIISGILLNTDPAILSIREGDKNLFCWTQDKKFFVVPSPNYMPKNLDIDYSLLKDSEYGFGLVGWYVHPELLKYSYEGPDGVTEESESKIKNRLIRTISNDEEPYLSTILDLDQSHLPVLLELRNLIWSMLKNEFSINPEQDSVRIYFHFPYPTNTVTLHVHIRVNQEAHPLEIIRSITLDSIITAFESGKDISDLIFARQKENIVHGFIATPVAIELLSNIDDLEIAQIQNPYMIDTFDWNAWCKNADEKIEIDFKSNWSIYVTHFVKKDPLALNFVKMGYDFRDSRLGGTKKPAPIRESIAYINRQLDLLLNDPESGITEADILRPGKVFMTHDDKHLIVPFGEPIRELVKGDPVNVVDPVILTEMIAKGYFPIGEPLHMIANGTLAEHDLSHFLGWIENPRFMKSVRQAFVKLHNQLNDPEFNEESKQEIIQSLRNFESVLSFKLFFLLEFTTYVREEHREVVDSLLGFSTNLEDSYKDAQQFLLTKWEKEGTLALVTYLSDFYEKFPFYFNPIGGESRDILNRDRKYRYRSQAHGKVYPSPQSSPFNNQSIWSMFLNGCDALNFTREDQDDFKEVLLQVHAKLLAFAFVLNHIEIEEWVNEAFHLTPDKTSNVYRSIHDSGLWDEGHLFYNAFTSENYDQNLKELRDQVRKNRSN